MVQIRFAGVDITNILEPIKKTRDRDYIVNTFIGKEHGNDIKYVSTKGLVLSFTSIVKPGDLKTLSTYRWLEKNYTDKHRPLAGKGDLFINGNYYLTGYNEEKQLNGSFTIQWEFTEYLKPNITKKTFRRVGGKITTTTTKKSVKKTKNTYVDILLNSCGQLKYGMTGKKCVKYLQKFLQKKGYYMKYKVDGDYLKYTKQEVAKLQKAYKINVSKQNQGQWEKKTINYWKKKQR